ncbi:MAG: quinoprotein relay system zinc metallohydrolase 1 [Pseudomonadota bacterium]
MTTRRAFLGLLGAGAFAPRTWAEARHAYDIAFAPVGDGVWMLEGAAEYFSKENGGAIVNIALLQGETGIILVDTGPSVRYGEAIDLAIRQIDPRGVSAVFNTHYHPDHLFGNQTFASKPIYSLEPTVSIIDRDGDALADNMYRMLGDWMRGTDVVRPNRLVQGGEALIDGRRLSVLELGGHTAADLALVDSTTGTLIAGDIAFLDRAPTTPDADLPRWHAALDTLEGLNASQIIPGHGPLDPSGASIRQTRDYLFWLEDTLRGAVLQGLDIIEAMEISLPPEYAEMDVQPGEFRRSVTHLFPKFEREELPRAN